MIIDRDHKLEYTIDRPTNIPSKENLEEFFDGSIENYYVAHARYISSQYNIGNSGGYSHSKGKSGTQRAAEDSPVAQIYNNYSYVLGEQENFTYAFLTQDESGGQLPAPFVKGEQIFRLVEFMKNTLRKLLSNAKISVESLDPSAQSKKMQKLQEIMLKERLLEAFENLEANTGMGFYPEGMGQRDLDTAKEDLQNSPSDELEEGGLDLLTDAISRNRLGSVALRAAVDAIVGRHATIWPEVENGRLVAKAIPPYMMILDSSEDDDFRKRDEYRGFVEFLTESEISSRWALDTEERDLVKKLMSDSTLNSHYSHPSSGKLSFNWLNNSEGNTEKRIGCATMWFISESPSERDVEDGKVNRKGSDKYNKGEDYAEFTLERVTLIGNAIIKDYGNDTNVVFSPHDPSWPLYPLCTYTPNMYLGTSRSLVDRFKKYQDDMDAYEWKIKDMLSKDLGKVVFVNGYKVGESDTPQIIIDNLKKIGLHVTEGVDGEDPGMLDNKPMVQILDMSNYQGVQAYLALIAQKNQAMEEVIGATKASLGQVQRYIGHGSQQSAQDANAAGMGSYIDGFLEFYTYTLQYMLNKLKVMLADTEGAERAEMVLSEGKIKFFQNSTQFQVEDHMVAVTIEDIIDDQGRERLNVYIQAMVQNAGDTGIDWEDIIDLETARTYTELRRRLKKKIQAAKEEKKKEQLKAMEAQMAQEQRASEERMALQGNKEEGLDARHAAKLEADMAGKVLDKIPLGEGAPQEQAL